MTFKTVRETVLEWELKEANRELRYYRTLHRDDTRLSVLGPEEAVMEMPPILHLHETASIMARLERYGGLNVVTRARNIDDPAGGEFKHSWYVNDQRLFLAADVFQLLGHMHESFIKELAAHLTKGRKKGHSAA